jgi:hypothetical protein|tara:strand:- start:2493 stop:2873 length:381 start_codon:yes stop_codon:yes gene_type:complete
MRHGHNFISRELKYAILTDVASRYWSFIISYVDPDTDDDGTSDVIERYDLPNTLNSKIINKFLEVDNTKLHYKQLKIGPRFDQPWRCYIIPLSATEFEECKMVLGISLNSDIMNYVRKYKKLCITK